MPEPGAGDIGRPSEPTKTSETPSLVIEKAHLPIYQTVARVLSEPMVGGISIGSFKVDTASLDQLDDNGQSLDQDHIRVGFKTQGEDDVNFFIGVVEKVFASKRAVEEEHGQYPELVEAFLENNTEHIAGQAAAERAKQIATGQLRITSADVANKRAAFENTVSNTLKTLDALDPRKKR